MIIQNFIKILHTVHELWPVRFFSEFGHRQRLDRRQFAFGSLFGLDLVNINVYANFYQNISTVQEIGPVFVCVFRIFTSAKPRPNCTKIDNWLEFVNMNMYAKFYRNITKGARDMASFTFISWFSSPRASGRFNDVTEGKRFEGVFLCKKVCWIQKSNS